MANQKKIEVEVGDYIWNKEGKFMHITAEDMPTLRYEDIDRKATPEENPNWEFTLKDGEWKNLNKENFFNTCMQKCPKSTQAFCDWIDKYKKANKWKQLFNSDSNWQDSDGKNAPAPKFHEIPWEMQFGILIQFFSTKMGFCGFPLGQFEDWQEQEEIVNSFVYLFIELQVLLVNGDVQ